MRNDSDIEHKKKVRTFGCGDDAIRNITSVIKTGVSKAKKKYNKDVINKLLCAIKVNVVDRVER